MQKTSSTYRLLALVTALSFLAGVILPSGVHAHGLISDLCDMESEMDIPERGEHCDLEIHADAPVPHHHGETEASEYELDIACPCIIEGTPVKPEAIPVTYKTQVSLSTSDFTFGSNRNAPKFITGSSPALHSSSRPIFLLVSSFLN